MTINLKIEIIKIFSLEFSLSSDKKKDELHEEATDTQSADAEPPSSSK